MHCSRLFPLLVLTPSSNQIKKKIFFFLIFMCGSERPMWMDYFSISALFFRQQGSAEFPVNHGQYNRIVRYVQSEL